MKQLHQLGMNPIQDLTEGTEYQRDQVVYYKGIYLKVIGSGKTEVEPVPVVTDEPAKSAYRIFVAALASGLFITVLVLYRHGFLK